VTYSVFTLIQLSLVLAVLIVVAERARVLWFRAPVSGRLCAELERCVRAGRLERVEALCSSSPFRWACRAALVARQKDVGTAADALFLDLRYEAERRLVTLRIAATLASTLGLLGGILAIRQGFGAGGLLALESGLAQQVALARALSTMALGIGTSAICFAAFAAFRTAARHVLSQAQRVLQAHVAASPH
jgi:biopolymer transport protein ExbB/TolQ